MPFENKLNHRQPSQKKRRKVNICLCVCWYHNIFANSDLPTLLSLLEGSSAPKEFIFFLLTYWLVAVKLSRLVQLGEPIIILGTLQQFHLLLLCHHWHGPQQCLGRHFMHQAGKKIQKQSAAQHSRKTHHKQDIGLKPGAEQQTPWLALLKAKPSDSGDRQPTIYQSSHRNLGADSVRQSFCSSDPRQGGPGQYLCQRTQCFAPNFLSFCEFFWWEAAHRFLKTPLNKLTLCIYEWIKSSSFSDWLLFLISLFFNMLNASRIADNADCQNQRKESTSQWFEWRWKRQYRWRVRSPEIRPEKNYFSVKSSDQPQGVRCCAQKFIASGPTENSLH